MTMALTPAKANTENKPKDQISGTLSLGPLCLERCLRVFSKSATEKMNSVFSHQAFDQLRVLAHSVVCEGLRHTNFLWPLMGLLDLGFRAKAKSS